jgi:hypothetical protein
MDSASTDRMAASLSRAAVLLSALLGLCPVAAAETSAAPPAAVVEPVSVTPAATRPLRRWGMFGGGLGLFLTAWGLDLGLSYGVGAPRPALAIIPLAGPLIQLTDNWAMLPRSATGNAQIDDSANARIAQVNRSIQTAAYVVLSVDFVLQLAGATLAVIGVTPRSVARYARSTGTTVGWTPSGRGGAPVVTF